MKTFIHHNGALGDLLLSLPCIRAIKEKSGLIHIACRADVGGLLRETRCVDEASSSDSSLYSSLYLTEADAKAARFLSGFDRAFIFTTQNNSELALAVGRIIRETRTIITVPPDGLKEHAESFRLKQLAMAHEPQSRSPLLEIPSAYRASAKNILNGAGCSFDGTHLIALHPGSGGKRKSWPLENYLALAKKIIHLHNSFVLILSGPVEDAATKKEIDDFTQKYDNAAHVQDEELVMVAALLSLCTLYIGNDSGISHLAGAVSSDVIVLFGPTDPAKWRPSGGRVQVISAGSLSAISVEEVYAVTKDHLTMI